MFTAITWIEPKTRHSNRARSKVAAVSMSTDQIVRIYANCIEAARKLIMEKYLTFTPSMDLVADVAHEIAEAANSYHVERLGYYWKFL